jgi:hypothetical protein
VLLVLLVLLLLLLLVVVCAGVQWSLLVRRCAQPACLLLEL